MAKSEKCSVEIRLVRAELSGLPEKALLKSRNLGCLDLIWPRVGVSKKSAAREFVFRRGVADFSGEEWTKRTLLREEIDGHCGLAVSITEPVSVQKMRRFLRLTAKYALKMGADFMEKALVGYDDIASAPLDALAQMIGEKDAPTVIARGVVDVTELPPAGQKTVLEIPLERPLTHRSAGTLTIEIVA